MDIQTELRGDIHVIRPVGRVDSTNAAEFEKTVSLEFNQDTRKIALDFSKLEYISSAGLRVVLIAGKKIKAMAGGKLVLCSLSTPIHEVFEISGFLPIFTITPDLDSALTQLA